MGTYKTDRTAEDIRREIMSVIRNLKDPRISGYLISVSRIELARDLSYAKVYISALEGIDISLRAVAALTNATGLIRREIGSKIRIRKIPELKFIADNSIQQGMEIVERMNILGKDKENSDEN
ncbi:MAG: Ribosome-binding factor A [Firmicutes bacterium ADurb.Bin300]|jgi:ribosome-binding factor A|nr:MAG: Ribosome-binding factor A [Firmicutes bacterium ADurb.Bin300]HOD03362.1 30S ribosome-binding factor RbfA [Clostridiales bacterium]